MRSALRGIWRQLCPRCRQGAIYRAPLLSRKSLRGFLAMYEVCPVCGLKYDREPGYFVGAMYVSYLFSIPPAFLIALALWHWTGWAFNLVMLGVFVCYLPLVPFVTRMSRVVWIWTDQHFDPEV